MRQQEPTLALVVGCGVPRAQVAYVVACLAVIGGSLGYMLCDFGGWPLLVYEPFARSWQVTSSPPSAAAILYPGMLLWGLCGSLVFAAIGVVVASRRATALSGPSVSLLGAWAVSSVAFVSMYFLWGLWPF